jgi:hypothetical protein
LITVDYIEAGVGKELAENLTRFFKHISSEYNDNDPQLWIRQRESNNMPGAFAIYRKKEHSKNQ